MVAVATRRGYAKPACRRAAPLPANRAVVLITNLRLPVSRRTITTDRPLTGRLVLALGTAALLVALLAVLLTRASEDLGNNDIRPFGFFAELGPRAEVCDGSGRPRPDAEAVEVMVGLDGRPPQPLALRVADRPASRPVTAVDGVTRFPLPAGTSLAGQLLCLRNVGSEPVLLAGQDVPGATLDGRPRPYRVSYAFVDGSPPRRADIALEALHDVGNARGGAGGAATGWLVAALALAALGTALGGAWRVLR